MAESPPLNDADCMLLSDAADAEESVEYLLLSWNEHIESPRRISVARRVDYRAIEIRAKYLSFVHELGRTRLGSATVIDRLATRYGYSLWWSSSIAEKSPFKTPAIVECLKLFALEEILIEQRPRVLRIRLSRRVARAASTLARRLGIEVRLERAGGDRMGLKDIFRRLPAPLQAGVWLFRHLLPRLVLARAKKVQWFAGHRSLTFFSYFFNLDQPAYREGKFRPAQWGDFPKFCAARGVEMNFAHHFLPTPFAPRPADALAGVRRFNSSSVLEGAHTFIDSFVGPAELWRATLSYIGIAWRSAALPGLRAAFKAGASHASMWPLLRDDWRDSVRGRVAFQACIWLEAFESLMRTLPRQNLGLYLLENQGWERTLLHAWRRHGHGAIVGVAHSTVRFWDLRYYDDPREYTGPHELQRPAPDEVALNGSLAEQMYRDAAYPRATVAVEALRFMHLANQERAERLPVERNTVTLLVAGDSAREATAELLSCLAAVSPAARAGVRILFKAHPWCPVDLAAFGLPDVVQRSESIVQLMHEVDIVCGGTSSVTLEAYCAGTQVIVFIARGSLNFSPVIGLDGARMVHTPEELAAALEAMRASAHHRQQSRALFHVDPSLPRWTRLLQGHGVELAPGSAA